MKPHEIKDPRQRQMAYDHQTVTKLQREMNTTEWEATFLDSVEKRLAIDIRELTPKQQAVLDRLETKHNDSRHT